MYKSENLFADKVPTCTCGGFIKPDIVFFGESLPEKYWQLSKEVPILSFFSAHRNINTSLLSIL